MKESKSFLQKLFSATFLFSGLNFVRSIIIANLIGPKSYGTYLFVLMLLQLMQFGSLGYFQGMQKELNRRTNEQSKVINVSWYRGSRIGYIIAIGLVSILIYYLLANDFEIYRVIVIVIFVFCLFVVEVKESFYQLYNRGLNDFENISIAKVYESTSRFITILPLFIVNIIYIPFVSDILSKLSSYWRLAYNKADLDPEEKIDKQFSKHLLTIGYPVLLVGFSQMSVLLVDRFFIGVFLSDVELGFYGLVIMFINTLIVFIGVGNSLAYSSTNFYLYNKYKYKAKVLLKIGITLYIVISILVMIISFKYVGFVVHLLGLDEYTSGIKAVKVISLSTPFLFLYSLNNLILNVYDENQAIIKSALIAVLTNTVLIIGGHNFFTLNIDIVSFTTFISYIIAFIYTTYATTKLIKIYTYDFIRWLGIYLLACFALWYFDSHYVFLVIEILFVLISIKILLNFNKMIHEKKNV